MSLLYQLHLHDEVSIVLSPPMPFHILARIMNWRSSQIYPINDVNTPSIHFPRVLAGLESRTGQLYASCALRMIRRVWDNPVLQRGGSHDCRRKYRIHVKIAKMRFLHLPDIKVTYRNLVASLRSAYHPYKAVDNLEAKQHCQVNRYFYREAPARCNILDLFQPKRRP